MNDCGHYRLPAEKNAGSKKSGLTRRSFPINHKVPAPENRPETIWRKAERNRHVSVRCPVRISCVRGIRGRIRIAVLGHSDASTTFREYVPVSRRMARRLQKDRPATLQRRAADQQEPGRYPRQDGDAGLARGGPRLSPIRAKAIEKGKRFVAAEEPRVLILPRPRLNPAIRLSTMSPPPKRAIRPGHVVTFEASFSASILGPH